MPRLIHCRLTIGDLPLVEFGKAAYAVFMVRRKLAKVLDPAWFGAPRCMLKDLEPVTDLILDIPNEDFARQAQEFNPALEVLPSERKLDTVDGRVAGTHHMTDVTAAINARVTSTLKARQRGDADPSQ